MKKTAQQFGSDAHAARKTHGGLIQTQTKVQVSTPDELATYYTPGVGHICQLIADNSELARELTMKKDTVAMISDGTAVLGFGDIGEEAVLPILEGKAIILKQFGDINASPILLSTKNVDEMFKTIKNISAGFGGIFLEDISAPRCFELENRLSEALDIPVFHDDQHGTAIVALGALMNAAKVTGRNKEDLNIVMTGAGAAGIATAKLLKAWGVGHLTLVDSRGIVSYDRCEVGQDCLPPHKKEFALPKGGLLNDALKKANVFIGVSAPGLLTAEMVQSMEKNPIIFALANPTPEIMPDIAKNAGAAVVATGRSDFPNQINNALVFPGIFKGLLAKKVNKVTPEMKLRAATALAGMVANPTAEKIVPGVFDEGLADVIAEAI